MEHVLEHDVVDVLAEEVEQEPVAHAGLVHHNLDTLGLDASVAELEQVDPQGAGQTQRNPAKCLLWLYSISIVQYKYNNAKC